MFRTLLTSLTAVLFLTLAPPSSGQCFGPDGLDFNGCCQPSQAVLPSFPQGALQGLGICWNNCTLPAQNNLRVTWTPPAFQACAQYTSTVTASDSTGAPLLAGPMVLDYTRTWVETDPNTGGLVQIWRFAAKADLSSLTTTGTPPCPVPPCLFPVGPHQTAFFYGYVDYALDCATPGTFQSVLVLYHGSDWLQHKPVFSSRPGVFHPATSYAIVAPHTTVNPFVPANIPAPGGPLVAEAVRRVAVPGATCMTEEYITGGNVSPFVTGCMSPPSLAAGQVTLSLYQGSGSCPDTSGLTSGFQATALAFPTLPWPYLVTTSIGTWTGVATYPGPEMAWVDEALVRYYDSCVSNDFFEVLYGASTDQGWTVVPTSPVFPPTQRFRDMADNWSAPVVGIHPLPILGHIMPSDHLIYTNIP